MLVLQATADEATDVEEEGNEGDDEVDDEDREEEEDPLSTLDDDERKALIHNTEAVRTTLMKVCAFLSFFFAFVLISVANIGSQTLLCHCPFHHHFPSRMA